jgi:gamma-glutamyltranspeptidase/glutathione hydrolase
MLLHWVGFVFLFSFSYSLRVDASAVSSSTPESSQAAMAVLKSGGNAVDAACAAVFALNVTQPHFTGLGGGGFALVHLQGKGDSYFDFRESAPASVTSDLFLDAEEKPKSRSEKVKTGVRSIGVPGNVAGCGRLVTEYGKLGWKRIFDPAIRIAQEGFMISQLFQDELSDQWDRISIFDFTRSLLKGPGGSGLKKGDYLKQPRLAKTFEALAEKGPESFYRGELAQKWLKEARALGVPLTSKDLESYRVVQRDVVSFEFGGLRGVTVSPPSSAGLTVAATSRYMDHYYGTHKKTGISSAERYVIEIEAKGYFAKMRNAKLADPPRIRFSVAEFIRSDQEKKAWKELDQRVQTVLARVGKVERRAASSGTATGPERMTSHTAHVSVVDDFGNAVALTSSVGNIFGSGVILPDSGFVLNSTLEDFDSESDRLNSPQALARPLSNMSPVFLYENQSLVGVMGGAGGPLIPSAIVDFMQNYYFHQLSGADAIRFPRVHSEDGQEVAIEKSAPPATIEKLKRYGYKVHAIPVMWAVFEGVVRHDSKQKWEAVAETRYDGMGLTQ